MFTSARFLGRGVEAYQEPASDPENVAHAIARTLPAMIQEAEGAGLTTVADHLTRALQAAEGGPAKHEPPLKPAE